LQVVNTHATRRAILFKNLNYILREICHIPSEDALNYPVKRTCTDKDTTLNTFLKDKTAIEIKNDKSVERTNG